MIPSVLAARSIWSSVAWPVVAADQARHHRVQRVGEVLAGARVDPRHEPDHEEGQARIGKNDKNPK